MRVAPRDLKAVRAGGLVTRYAVLGGVVFAIVELPEDGSAGTAVEDPCRLEHWGLVLQGELTLEGRRTRIFGPGTAFYVAPGPVHRFRAGARAVVAGFVPVTGPVDESPAALRARGIEILRRTSSPVLPPTSIHVAGTRTRTAASGEIQTQSATMGDWLFTRSAFGRVSGYAEGWCDLSHWGLVLDGSLVLHLEDGELELLGPGDAFHTPGGPPGHRIEVAEHATIVDYTPIREIDDPLRRRAPRTIFARYGHGRASGTPSGVADRRLDPEGAAAR